jgi:hypothetical protein
MTESFEVVEELAGLKSLLDTTRGEDLVLSVCETRRDISYSGQN